MLGELTTLDAPRREVEALPSIVPEITRPSSREDEGTSALRAQITRSLPTWHAERKRLRQDRIGRRDTTDADRLVVGFVKAAGIAVAIAVGFLSVKIASSYTGAPGRVAIGVIALSVALVAASAAVRVARTLFERAERTRRENVARFDREIHELDGRIDGAFRLYGIAS